MNETIIIHREPTGFSAEFFGAEAARMKALFGTCVVPTPFTPHADPLKVKASIQDLNAGTDVYLCDCVHLSA